MYNQTQKLSENLKVIPASSANFTKFEFTKIIDGEEKNIECDVPQVLISYLKNDPELLRLLSKSPNELEGKEKNILYALNYAYLKGHMDDTLLEIFANNWSTAYQGTRSKKNVLSIENEKLIGWAEYNIVDMATSTGVSGLKITTLRPDISSITLRRDFLNLFYNLLRKYDWISWVADPSNHEAVSVYNQIYNICKGRKEHRKSLPYDIAVTDQGLYGYSLTKDEVLKSHLWDEIRPEHLSTVENV